jgi:hypothetical protein
VRSSERHEEEQRKSKRERQAKPNSNGVRETVTHGVFSGQPSDDRHGPVTIRRRSNLILINDGTMRPRESRKILCALAIDRFVPYLFSSTNAYA